MDKCVTCRYNTNSYVCHPHCSGCDGKSNYERGKFKLKGYNELATIIHENAVTHGWWDKERSFAEVVALIHSELSEALEEYRSGKPNLWFACIPTDIFNGCRNMTHCESEKGVLGCAKTTEFCRYKDKKPEGIVVELADAIIRILDYCGFAGIDIEKAMAEQRADFDAYTLPELIAECHYILSKAYKNVEERAAHFAECISIINFWAKENGGDLEEAIVLKHEYNKSRPYRHGGKKC